MPPSIIACDLGTGGVKAALYDFDGRCLCERTVTYSTFYPAPTRHEQRPADWWDAVLSCIKSLLDEPGVEASGVRAIALSGHSLGCIPLSAEGDLLQDAVPIWSDGRAEAEAAAFLSRFDERTWYRTTGNGFPAPLYTLFKVLWLRAHEPAIFARTKTIIGTKDYINYKLTGVICTDHSYASGSGVYDLLARDYAPNLLDAAGLDRALFPPIVASTDLVGLVLPQIAAELGLPPDVAVVAGGVDNSCMALGARTFREGDVFSAMGSSSWLTIASGTPLLHDLVKPYVFAHVVPGMFISATSIFSSGTSLAWVRETLMSDLGREAAVAGRDVHEGVMALAAQAPRGAHGLVFVPTLGGGTSLEGGPAVRGAFLGLDLKHTRADVLRATLEGIAMGLRIALDELRNMTPVREELVMVGGGARSPLWRQIFADAMDCTILKTSVDQQAASLGAAALALVGLGIWHDVSRVADQHVVESRSLPEPGSKEVLAQALAVYRKAADQQRLLADDLAQLRARSS